MQIKCLLNGLDEIEQTAFDTKALVFTCFLFRMNHRDEWFTHFTYVLFVVIVIVIRGPSPS